MKCNITLRDVAVLDQLALVSEPTIKLLKLEAAEFCDEVAWEDNCDGDVCWAND